MSLSSGGGREGRVSRSPAESQAPKHSHSIPGLHPPGQPDLFPFTASLRPGSTPPTLSSSSAARPPPTNKLKSLQNSEETHPLLPCRGVGVSLQQPSPPPSALPLTADHLKGCNRDLLIDHHAPPLCILLTTPEETSFQVIGGPLTTHPMPLA